MTTSEPAETGQPLQDVMGSLLDVAGILAVAVGATWGLWKWLGPFSLIVGGILLLMMSAVAAAMRDRPAPVEEKAMTPSEVLPGPGHPGRIHVSGR